MVLVQKKFWSMSCQADLVESREDGRTEFQKLMKLVEQQRIEKVIVTRLDRLSRSLPTLRRILDTFDESGVALVVCQASICGYSRLSRTQASAVVNCQLTDFCK